jgi:hypothetical protein
MMRGLSTSTITAGGVDAQAEVGRRSHAKAPRRKRKAWMAGMASKRAYTNNARLARQRSDETVLRGNHQYLGL